MKKKILTIVGGLAFIALMAVNFQNSNNYNNNGVNLKLLEQKASANPEFCKHGSKWSCHYVGGDTYMACGEGPWLDCDGTWDGGW